MATNCEGKYQDDCSKVLYQTHGQTVYGLHVCSGHHPYTQRMVTSRCAPRSFCPSHSLLGFRHDPHPMHCRGWRRRAPPHPPIRSQSTVDRETIKAFKLGQYDEVVRILHEHTSDGKEPNRELLRLACISHIQLGHPEEATKLYMRLFPPGQSEDFLLLKQLASAQIISRVRDPQEHIRIAAYHCPG